MDLTDALKIWDEMGNTTESHDDENNNYVIEFINKSGEVVGNITAYPGQGVSWNYPQELMDHVAEKLDIEETYNALKEA